MSEGYFVVVLGLLSVVVSTVVEHGSRAWGLQQSRCEGSAAMAHGLWNAGSGVAPHQLSCSAARGIFPDQGPNPCPLHCKVDYQPVDHQGKPLK